jgi:DNA anti-recombination protein RmuC
MDSIIEEMAKLGKEIDKAKLNVSQLNGRRSEVIQRVETELGVSTVEELKTLQTQTQQNLEEIEATIRTDFIKLKEKFSW